MKNSKKQIIQEIEHLDRKLQYQQIQKELHRGALIQFLEKNKVAIVACLLPLIYFLPWKKLPVGRLLLGSKIALKHVLRLTILK